MRLINRAKQQKNRHFLLECADFIHDYKKSHRGTHWKEAWWVLLFLLYDAPFILSTRIRFWLFDFCDFDDGFAEVGAFEEVEEGVDDVVESFCDCFFIF